jgi:hypothetical protein
VPRINKLINTTNTIKGIYSVGRYNNLKIFDPDGEGFLQVILQPEFKNITLKCVVKAEVV